MASADSNILKADSTILTADNSTVRYLIGTGARSWNNTAIWSLTSGGAGGASVPTSSDSVVFDANSGTGTITVNVIANMLDFTCSNIGALTLSNAAYAFNVFGSLTLHTNLTVTFTSTGYLYMKATDSRNITTNGKVANWNRMYFDGVGGTWTNQDDMNISATVINHVNGTWNSNNYIITCTGSYNTVAGTKVLTLGSSVFNLGTWNNEVPTGFTFNQNTSTVNITAASTFTGANTFYNLTFTGTAAITALNSLTANITVSNNLTFTGSNASTNRLLIASNTIGTPRTITCNGTVTASNVDFRDITLAGTCNKDLSAITGGSGDCGGNSGITFTTAQAQYFKKYASTANYGDVANWRSGEVETLGSELITNVADREFTSDTGFWTKGTGWNITGGLASCDGVQAISYFRGNNKITINKWYLIILTVNRISGTLNYIPGNAGSNNNISASGTYNLYIYHNGITSDIVFQSFNFNGSIDNISVQEVTNIGRVPLPQDLGSKFLATSFNQTCTVSCNVPRIPCLDMSEVVNTVTWSLSYNVAVYGSYVLGNNITHIGTVTISLLGIGNYNLDMLAKRGYYVSVVRGNYTLLSDVSISGILTVTAGATINCNIYNIDCYNYSVNNTGVSYCGSGIISVINSFSLSTQSFPQTATIKMNLQSGSGNMNFNGAGLSYNKVWISGLHTGYTDIVIYNNTIAELIIDSGRKVRFTAGTTQTINKATIGANVTLDCITALTYNLALGEVVTAENINIKGCTVTQDSKFFAEANSVDSGSNTRVTFGDYFVPQEIMIE